MKKFITWFAQPKIARKAALFALWISGFYTACFILGGQAWLASIVIAAGVSGFIVGQTQAPKPLPEEPDEVWDEVDVEFENHGRLPSEFDQPGEIRPYWR